VEASYPSFHNRLAFRSAYTLSGSFRSSPRATPSPPPCSSRLASNFNNSGNAQNPIMSSPPHPLVLPPPLSLSLPLSCSKYVSLHVHARARARFVAYAAYIRKSSRDRPPYPFLKFHPRGLATPCPARIPSRLPIGGGAPGNLIFRNDDANSVPPPTSLGRSGSSTVSRRDIPISTLGIFCMYPRRVDYEYVFRARVTYVTGDVKFYEKPSEPRGLGSRWKWTVT